MRIVITEFMDEAAVARLAAQHDTLYDRRWSTGPRRSERLAAADALIVRNRTQVDAALLAAAPGSRSSAGSASASTTSTSTPAASAASR